jgi:WD40 repeat protein
VKEGTVEAHNPYKGLRAFQEADAADFFGREALIRRLLARLGEKTELARFLAVVGPSGSGKSSVARAGLLPAIRAGALPGSERWPIVQMIPGSQPLEELEAALLRISVNPPESLMRQLSEDQRGLLRAIKRVLPEDPSIELFLLIDQFEEVFTLLSDEAARVRLLDSLYVAVADPTSRVRVVITLRADFYDRPLQYGQIGELLRARSELVLPLSTEDLERAIVGPAERVGVNLEAELLASLLRDTAGEPGTLPLLQYTLTELFERKQGSRLTVASYRVGGGLHSVLGRRAEEIYAGLTATEQQLVRQLFLRLVTLGEGVEDTRRRMRLEEVASLGWDSDSVTHVIEQFAGYRLLTLDRDLASGKPTVEVAHEALLQAWGRLREWLSSSREALQVQRRLMSSAAEWEASGRERSFLARGARLAQFAALAEESDQPGGVALTDEERLYLQASVEEQRRQETLDQERMSRELSFQKRATSRLRYLVAALGLFLLVATALAAWALNRSQVAQTEEQIAQTNLAHADALRLGTEANSLLQSHGDSQLIALLGIRSMNLSYSLQGEESLEAATRLDYPVRQFTGHTGPVLGVAFSPDGKFIATASSDTTARMWDVSVGTGSQYDVATTREVRTFRRHTAAVTGVAFMPDGKYLLTGSDDKTAMLWDVATGQQVRTFSGSDAGIGGLAVSPDGKYLVTIDGSTARLWDVATGAQVRSFTGHTGRLTGVAYSPDGKYLLTGGMDGTARLWDATGGQQVHVLPGHSGNVTALAYSPDGKYLATGSADQTIRIWDPATGNQLRVLPGPEGGPDALAFTRDSKYLLSGEDQQPVARLLDITSGQTVHLYAGQSSPINGVASITGVAVSPDGKWLAGASRDGSARLWPVLPTTGETQFTGHTGAVWRAALSPDGKEVLTASGDNTARLWNANTGEVILGFNGHTDEVRDAVFSPDGKDVVTASRDGTARMWDARTGKQLSQFTGHAGPVNGIAFSPDGKYVATASSDGTARLWDATTARVLVTFSGHAPQYVNQIAFSPDGQMVATTSDDKTARIWDRTSGKQLMVFEGHTDFVYGVAFSSDGKDLLTASFDGTARLWDIASGKELRRFVGHTGPVYGVAFSPDGKSVATSGADRTVRLWDVGSGVELRRFNGHGDEVRSVVFSSDGRYLLTASHDQSARLWHTDYHDTIDYLCGLLTRDLTPEERTQYGITDQQPTCPAH